MSILRKLWLGAIVAALCLGSLTFNPTPASAATQSSTCGSGAAAVATGSQSYTQSLGTVLSCIAISSTFSAKPYKPLHTPTSTGCTIVPVANCAGVVCVTAGITYAAVTVHATPGSSQGTYTWKDPQGHPYSVTLSFSGDQTGGSVTNNQVKFLVGSSDHSISAKVGFSGKYNASGVCVVTYGSAGDFSDLVMGGPILPPGPAPSAPLIGATGSDLQGRIFSNGDFGTLQVSPNQDFYVWQPVCGHLAGSNLPYVTVAGSETIAAPSSDGTREYFLNFSMTATATTTVSYNGNTQTVSSPGSPGVATYSNGQWSACPSGPGWSQVYKTVGTATVSVQTVVTFTFKYSYFDGIGLTTVVLPSPAPLTNNYGGPQSHRIQQAEGISQG